MNKKVIILVLAVSVVTGLLIIKRNEIIKDFNNMLQKIKEKENIEPDFSSFEDEIFD